MDKKQQGRYGLPMPYAGKRGAVFLPELRAYRHRQVMHARANPTYELGWGRPTKKTAEAAWETLSPEFDISIDRFLPKSPPMVYWDADAIAVTIKQAFTVAVDAALLAGEQGVMLTTNRVFDALAAYWSDRYREIRVSGRADCSWDMTLLTIRWSLRDLLRNGVRLDALWSTVRRSCVGLYTTDRIPKRGYTVDVDVKSRLYRTYRDIVDADGSYRRGSEYPRLVLADEQLPPPPANCDIANEWAYNRVVPGKKSIEMIGRLEAARLFVDVPALLEDVDRLEATATDLRERLQREYGVDVTKSSARPRGRRKTKSGTLRLSPRQWAMKHLRGRDVPAVKKLVEEYDAVTGQFKQVADVRDRLKEIDAAGGTIDGDVQIKSAFYKIVNRRYQPTNFWPAEVKGKDYRRELFRDATPDQPPPVGGSRELRGGGLWRISSRRGRWFRARKTGLEDGDRYPWWTDDWAGDRRPLVGVDVSSSQLQILAIFCGLTELEADLSQRSFKETLAAAAWARHEDPKDPFKLPGFDGPGDDKLKEAVKTAVMTALYGSELPNVAYELTTSWDDYGPGLGDAENVTRLLDTAQVTGLMNTYLPLCQTVADRAWKRDKFRGVMLTDPYDGVRIRWNPIRRRDHAVSRGRTKVYVKLPTGLKNAVGDYRVDHQALRRKVAPMLAHTLDAMFAGLVVEKLNDLGVRDIVSVHDCWMVASDAMPALYEAVRAAGEPWLRRLGGVYADLAPYLKKGSKHASRLQEWRQQWESRVATGDRWPKFRVSSPKLMELEIRPIHENPEGSLPASPAPES